MEKTEAQGCAIIEVLSRENHNEVLGSSLLSADLSSSDVTDSECKNVEALNLNFYEHISDVGLGCIIGPSNLTSLSLKRNTNITAKGLSMLSGFLNLSKLDIERCSGIHGGLIIKYKEYMEGLKKLEALNMNCCDCITDADMKPLSSKVTDNGVKFLKGLHKLALLNMERCPITATCLDSLSDLVALLLLNVSRSNITDDGCDKFSLLNLGFNDMSDAVLSHLKGLVHLKCLELSDTEVGNNGLRHLFGLVNLESLNLSFTLITAGGLRHLGLCFYYMPICFPESLVLLGSTWWMQVKLMDASYL
uniref:Uncharacterized protein n=1 Tax=Lactuca sativa TaxID=4236 RepID=A0A9R1WDT5_LACSA|nr:hypothetical protein LSAT_V11C100045390 [Lactuca sativa]